MIEFYKYLPIRDSRLPARCRLAVADVGCDEGYVVGSKSFRPDQLFKVTEIKQICFFQHGLPLFQHTFQLIH